MNLLVGLVIRSQFQEVLSRTNGGKVGLFQLSIISIDAKKQHKMDENVIVFKVWGSHGKDKLRHQICRGSIVVIEEVGRKRFSNYRGIGGDCSDTVFGNILAFTDFNSNDVIIYDKHPFICNDIIVRSNIINLVNKLNDAVSHDMQWSMLRSCTVKSQYKLDFHSMLIDTKATLYTIPLKLFMLPLLSKTPGDIFVMDNDGVCVKFYFSNTSSRLSFISTVRDVLVNNEIFPALSSFLVGSHQSDNNISAECWLENSIHNLSTDAKQYVFKDDDLSRCRSSELGSVVLFLLFENIAINSSYQHQLSSLRFLPHLSKIKLHCQKKKVPKTIINCPTNGQLCEQIVEPISSSLHEVPEVHFYTWRQFVKLLRSFSLTRDYKSTISSAPLIRDNNIPDIVPYPEGYILLLAYVHEVHFHGMDKESFHHNIVFPEIGNTDNDQRWYYRDAMLTLSPIGDEFDSTIKSIEEIESSVCEIIYKRFMTGSNVCTTLADQISQVILSTQCPFTSYSEPSSHLNGDQTPIESLLDEKPLLRTKDIIYAILQYHLSQAVAGESHQRQDDAQPRNFQPFENTENVKNGKRKFSKFQDDARNVSIITGKRRISSSWRFSAPSVLSQELYPILDEEKSNKFHDLEVSISERLTSMEQTLFESPKIQLPVLVSHEYQLNRLFCGISPKLVALDMYRQQESGQSAFSNGDNDSSPDIPYFKVCLSRLNKLLSLAQQDKQQQKPHIFACRLIPTVDEDGDITGDLILSLEDII